jgi:hypothetical protein
MRWINFLENFGVYFYSSIKKKNCILGIANVNLKKKWEIITLQKWWMRPKIFQQVFQVILGNGLNLGAETENSICSGVDIDNLRNPICCYKYGGCSRKSSVQLFCENGGCAKKFS